MIGAQTAYAQVSISSNTSTPIATATASNGSPADVDVTSNATLTINGQTPAITVNSNNSVINLGTITSNNVDGATGILVQGPATATAQINNASTINLSESYSASDSANTDGLTEAPYAQGNNRIGIRVTGPFPGPIINSSAISIQGNVSAGISVENTVGSLVNSGSIALVGDNGFGVHTTGEVTGDVNIAGTVNTKGQNTVGVQTNAPVDGAFRVYNSISTTGYAITARETGTILTNIQKTPADLQQGGSAVVIGSNVLGGVFLSAPPATTVSTDATTDADGDGVVDSVQGTASLSTYGSAPALKIGGSSPITIGNFAATGYGLVIEGTVTGQGIWDGVSSTAVDISGAGVNLSGGIHVANTASVTAVSYQANATAMHLGAGVSGSALLNEGTISAALTSSGAHTAAALQIDAGASVSTLINLGTISATTTGDAASALAVVDKGGQISSVANYGAIAATLTPALPGETVTGTGVALDLSANTTGVILVQAQFPGTINTPGITGDVLLGSGPNSVSLLAGAMTGSLSMGSAASSLTIDNGASYKAP
ncbi:MAG: hypothetical protein WDN45_18630 [Caulobacteraceae bacterium]